jgi:hypothetical protein
MVSARAPPRSSIVLVRVLMRSNLLEKTAMNLCPRDWSDSDLTVD